MTQIAINWSENNQKLRCKSNYWGFSVVFNVGDEYKIYRIVYTSKFEFAIYMLNKQENKHVTFYKTNTHKDNPNINDYFDGVDVIVKKIIRKLKLKKIGINNY